MEVAENEIRLSGAEIPFWLYLRMVQARHGMSPSEYAERDYKIIVERNLTMTVNRDCIRREEWRGHGPMFDSSGFGWPFPQEFWLQFEWVVATMRAQREKMLNEWRDSFPEKAPL